MVCLCINATLKTLQNNQVIALVNVLCFNSIYAIHEVEVNNPQTLIYKGLDDEIKLQGLLFFL